MSVVAVGSSSSSPEMVDRGLKTKGRAAGLFHRERERGERIRFFEGLKVFSDLGVGMLSVYIGHNY